MPAADVRAKNAGLLLAYEKTGYDASTPGRLPDLLSIWSVKRLKEAGADACKFLLYYDVDEAEEINNQNMLLLNESAQNVRLKTYPSSWSLFLMTRTSLMRLRKNTPLRNLIKSTI